MFEISRTIALITFLWAVFALSFQVASTRPRRKDLSVPAGSQIQGVIYNFTWAMTPWRKETIRLHPDKFVLGILMHMGIFLAILRALVFALIPQNSIPNFPFLAFVFGISALSSLYLLLRRALLPELRKLSIPDDYFSIILILGFLTMAGLHEASLISERVFLFYTSAVFFYMPFGKLRHPAFFFAARAELGSRLGYRGVYPPPKFWKGYTNE